MVTSALLAGVFLAGPRVARATVRPRFNNGRMNEALAQSMAEDFSMLPQVEPEITGTVYLKSESSPLSEAPVSEEEPDEKGTLPLWSTWKSIESMANGSESFGVALGSSDGSPEGAEMDAADDATLEAHVARTSEAAEDIALDAISLSKELAALHSALGTEAPPRWQPPPRMHPTAVLAQTHATSSDKGLASAKSANQLSGNSTISASANSTVLASVLSTAFNPQATSVDQEYWMWLRFRYLMITLGGVGAGMLICSLLQRKD